MSSRINIAMLYSRMNGPLFAGLFVCFMTSPFCCVLVIYLYFCQECREQPPTLQQEMELVQDGEDEPWSIEGVEEG